MKEQPLHQRLSPQQYAAAGKFLLEQASPRERALFRFHFAGGAADDVLRELAAFQNPDGGFGRASEPDLRTPDSSAIATAHGIRRGRGATPSPKPGRSRRENGKGFSRWTR